jgi:2-dehydro-3-deoxygluconokinase
MEKIFCFGELLLRMSPSLQGGWIQQNTMPVYIGGAELNVATALSRWKLPVKYGTALPDNSLSHEIISELHTLRIDTSAIHLSGSRIGIYFLSQGADLKNAGVIYDRANSSFASLHPGMLNWNELLQGCSWLHWTAISPALTEHTAALCKEMLQAAHVKGITISVDLNYRSKLWQYGKQPAEVMPQLVSYCDVVMGNVWAAEQLLGITTSVKDSSGKSMEELVAAAGDSMKKIHTAYPQVQTMAYTFRMAEKYFAVLQHGPAMVVSKEFPLADVVDKAGSGDCFMAGLIYGLVNRHQPQHIINFAAAAATGKMKEMGDATRQDIDSVLKIVNSSWTASKTS